MSEFFCSSSPGLRGWKSILLIFKFMKVFITPLHETYDHYIWHVCTSREVDSNETNHTSARDINTSISPHKLKTLYLYFQTAYDHQTWQYGNLPWWALAHKVTWPFDHLVLRDQVTNQNHYIFNKTVSMTTKLDRLITNLEKLLPIMLLDP